MCVCVSCLIISDGGDGGNGAGIGEVKERGAGSTKRKRVTGKEWYKSVEFTWCISEMPSGATGHKIVELVASFRLQ